MGGGGAAILEKEFQFFQPKMMMENDPTDN